jgi:hypothetical protein
VYRSVGLTATFCPTSPCRSPSNEVAAGEEQAGAKGSCNEPCVDWFYDLLADSSKLPGNSVLKSGDTESDLTVRLLSSIQVHRMPWH